MRKLKRAFACAVIMMMAMVSYAYDAEVNGIYYNVDKTTKEAEVSSHRYNHPNEVTIPSHIVVDGTTYSVTSIGSSAFEGCYSLTSLTLPNSLTSIGSSAFRDCSGLTSLTLPNSLTSIGSSAFCDCSGLTSLTLPNSLTSIADYAFCDCSGLTSLTLPNSLTSIGYYAFYGCSGLTSLTLPNSLTSIGYRAFYCCSGLTSLTLPNSLTSIGQEAFWGCKLQSLTIGTGVTTIGSYAFSEPVKTIWLTNTAPSGYSWAMGNVNYVANTQFGSSNSVKKYSSLSSMFEVDGIKYVISSAAERTCDAIDCLYDTDQSDFKIGATVTYKGVVLKVKSVNDYALHGRKGIEHIELMNAGQVGDYVFENCTDLQSVEFGDGVQSLGEYAFNNCSKIQNIELPSNLASVGSYAFQNCSSLNGLLVPSSVTTLGNYAFAGCTSMKRFVIEDRETPISLGSNGSSAFFASCPLEEVYIGGKIEYNISSSYGYSPFYRNKTLRSVEITDKEQAIYDNEFYGCSGLETVKLGDGVKSIGKWAFSGCSSLQSFTFGSSLQEIGTEAFSDCISMTTIVSKAAIPPVCGSQALEDINKWDCTLYVPSESIASYQVADQWLDFFFISDNSEMLPSTPVISNMNLADVTAYSNSAAKQCEKLSYSRSFSNTNWQSLYVPFTMSYTDWMKDFDVARINAVHQYDDNEDGTIDRTELEVIMVKNGDVEPNTPYLIRAKKAGQATINLTNAVLEVTEENSYEMTSWNTRFTFTGTYHTIGGSEMLSNGYYAMGTNGSLVQAKSSSSNLGAFRWYLTVTDRNGNRKDINEVKIHVFGDEDDCQQTSVNDVFDHTGDADMFDLNGRKVEQMRKGIYVKNGKKIVVR